MRRGRKGGVLVEFPVCFPLIVPVESMALHLHWSELKKGESA